MKRRVALADVKAGAMWSEDVYIDDRNLLVPANVAVRQKDLDQLRRWGITHVMTAGDLLVELTKRATSRNESAAMGFAGSHKLYKRYTDLVDALSVIFDQIGRAERVDTRAIDQITQAVLQLVRDERDESISAILGSAVKEDSLARSGINIGILSVVIGTTLRLPPYRLAYLATGALLHDVGMLRIPEDIRRKKGKLNEEEAQKVRSHPLLSYRTITKELMFPDDIGLVGLQHHERWDGEGYPRRNAALEIDLLARVVSVADAFEAMVSTKSYRNSMIGYAAMKALLSDNSRRFDPDILKAFIKSMGIYPLGSLVLLNNAAIGRVVESHSEAPLRPKLRIIVDEFGNKSDTGDLLDLLSEKALFIARAIDPGELVSA